jgi:hypothetical protein
LVIADRRRADAVDAGREQDAPTVGDERSDVLAADATSSRVGGPEDPVVVGRMSSQLREARLHRKNVARSAARIQGCDASGAIRPRSNFL